MGGGLSIQFHLRFKPIAIYFQRADSFLERFFKGSANCHYFPHAFHLGGELIFGAGEFFKGKSGHLDHHIINSGLKTGRSFPGDVVPDFIQGVSYGQLGCDFGNGKASSFTCQGRAPAHPRVHLNYHQLAVFWINRKLNIRPAGIHSNFTNNGNRGVPHNLIFLISKSLSRGNCNGIASMNSHRVKIFYRADNYHIVLEVAHYLQLKFLPANYTLFYQDFIYRAFFQSPLSIFFKFLGVGGDISSGSTQGEARADNGRIADFFDYLPGLLH